MEIWRSVCLATHTCCAQDGVVYENAVFENFVEGGYKGRQFVTFQGTCDITSAASWLQEISRDVESKGRNNGFVIAKTCPGDFVEGILVIKGKCYMSFENAPGSIKASSVKCRGRTMEKVYQLIDTLLQCTNFSTLKLDKSTLPAMEPADIQQELQGYAKLSKGKQAEYVLAIKTKHNDGKVLSNAEKLILGNQSLVNKAVGFKDARFAVNVHDPKCPALNDAFFNMDKIKSLRAKVYEAVWKSVEAHQAGGVMQSVIVPSLCGEDAFLRNFAKLVTSHTIVVVGTRKETEALCKALARGVAMSMGDSFLYVDTIPDLKKCVNAGSLQKNIPLVLGAISPTDKNVTVDVARCIMDKDYHGSINIPSSTLRLISTPMPVITWSDYILKNGNNALIDTLKGTVWVEMKDGAMSAEKHDDGANDIVDAIANCMNEGLDAAYHIATSRVQ